MGPSSPSSSFIQEHNDMDTSKLKLNYDQYAVELTDGKFIGPFKTWGQATVAKAHNSGVCITRCTGPAGKE